MPGQKQESEKRGKYYLAELAGIIVLSAFSGGAAILATAIVGGYEGYRYAKQKSGQRQAVTA